MNRPRILLFGSTGLLGSEVQRRKHPDAILTVPARDSYDFISAQSLEDCVKRFEPTHVINCAAMTNVDKCEGEQDRCYLVNAYAPGVIAEACAEMGARLVHISTDFVFNGTLTPPHRYHHTDPAIGPHTVYGQAKALSEERVQDMCPGALIIRSSWLFGGVRPTFPDWVLQRAETGNVPIELPTDRLGSPTYAPDLAKAIMDLALGSQFGVLHVTNDQDQPVSQLEYGQGCEEEIPQSPCRAAMQDDLLKRGDWKVRRPTNSALMSDVKLRHWREALRHYLDTKLSMQEA